MSRSPSASDPGVGSGRSLGREAALRSVLWLALGSWIGAWGFFAFVVSRIAFQVLPGDVAGNLAGVLLRVLHLGGAAAGLAAAAALIGLGRRGAIVAVPVVLAAICLGSEWLLSPEVAALRPSTLGPANTEETQTRFRLLHGVSLGLFMAVHLASVALLARVAWLEARDRESAASRGR